jgi:hypothetical protein
MNRTLNYGRETSNQNGRAKNRTKNSAGFLPERLFDE